MPRTPIGELIYAVGNVRGVRQRSGVLEFDLDVRQRCRTTNQDFALIYFALADTATVLHIDFTGNQF